jgi:hypothetical protein
MSAYKVGVMTDEAAEVAELNVVCTLHENASTMMIMIQLLEFISTY